MAEPQYTDAQLSDGTVLRLRGQLSPDEVAAKVKAFRSTQAPVQHHGASGGWGPEYDAPKNDLLTKIGGYVPEAATAPLAWLQRHYVDPTEKYVSTVGSVGRELGRETLGMGSDPNVQKKYGMEKSVPLHAALGAAGAVGSVAATTALDPRNWPLMASQEASPVIRRAMSGGFGVQMSKGAYDAADQLSRNWDKLSVEERAELGTQAGINALMAAASGRHALEPHAQAPEVKPAESIPGSTEPKPNVLRADTQPPQLVSTKGLSDPSTVATPEPRSITRTASASVTPPAGEPGEGFRMPKTGEVVQEQYTHKYPSKEEMRFRSFKKLEYTQRELDKAVESKDPAAIDAAQKRVVGDALTWAQHATPDDIDQAMSRLHNNTSLLGSQIAKMDEMNRGLLQGKLSFSQAKDARQITPGEFKDVVGVMPRSVPKDFVSTLPEDVRNAISAKGRERSEIIKRLYAARLLQERGAARLGEFNRAYELQSALAQAKGLKTPPKGSYILAKNVPATEAPVSAEVGGESAATAESRPAEQPIQTAQAPAGPGEPVHPAERPSVEEAVNMNRRIADYIAKTDAVRAEIKSGQEPPSRLKGDAEKIQAEMAEDKEAARLKQLATPKLDTNFFALAQQDLRQTLGREPSISEVAQHAAVLKGKLAGVTDPRLEEKIQTLLKKGMARGSAERMAKEQLAKERDEERIREEQTARPGERGSLSFRRLQPTIGPLGPSPTWRLASFLDRLAGVERSPEETKARDITRGFAAGLALDHLKLEAKLKEAIDRHDADGKDEFRTFMDAGEGKIAQGPVNFSQVGMNSPHPQAPFMTVQDVATAQELHGMFQERWSKIQRVLDKDPGGIENYLAHLWKQPGLAKKTMNYFFGRRPIEGNKIFLKQRFYEYASDGLDHNLEPITYNPIRMQLTALFQMDKFLAAHELKDMYKDAGLIKWSKLGDTSTVGWQSLNDKIFQPKIMKDGGLVEYGQWKAPADVAKIFNRYVDPGLRGNPTYDAIRQYGNLLNQVNLGVSGYHGLFITLVAAGSDNALGLEKVFNNFDAGGFKDMLRGSVGTFMGLSAIRDYQLGRKIQAEAINPTGNAHLQAFVDSLVQGGARFAQDPLYETDFRKFTTELKQGHPIEAIKSGVQNLSKPIMKYYVPRVKLGIAAQMMDSRLRYLIKQGITDPDTIANENGKIWDSVDNRAGQMVYDNLFWNKAAKDISFLAVRAVGWDFGSIREGIGGLWKDPLRQTAKALRGERPELTHRTAFVAGTVMTVATLGAVTTYLATGKPPQKLEDYFYPPSGRMGPDGKPERMSYPSYMKDAFAITHDIKNLKADTALHKAHPMINQVAEFLQNKDFYNTEIRSEGDPWYAQSWQVGKWYGKSFLPFSATMAQQRASQGIPPLVAYAESFFGLQRAPSYVTQSPAEEMALDFAKRNWKAGPLSSEEREQRNTYNHFKGQIAMGKLDTKAVSQAFTTGKLRETDLDRLFEDQGLSSFQQEFKSLHLRDALKVMQVARPEERQQLKMLLLDKEDEIETMPVPEERAYYLTQIQKYLQ